MLTLHRMKGNVGLLRLKAVSSETRQKIEEKIGGGAVAGMLNLLDVLELVVNGFNEDTFTKPKFIEEREKTIGHILANRGDQA